MATYTFQKTAAAPRTQTHAHAGGLLTISANQRGVILQFDAGSGPRALHNQSGRNPLNQGSFELGPGDIIMSVGDHAYGKNNEDIIVDIV